MKYLIALVLVTSSCSLPTPKIDRVDIRLKNTTNTPIEVRAKAGFLGKTIRLNPGETWKGWIPPNIPVSEIAIEVRKEGRK